MNPKKPKQSKQLTAAEQRKKGTEEIIAVTEGWADVSDEDDFELEY